VYELLKSARRIEDAGRGAAGWRPLTTPSGFALVWDLCPYGGLGSILAQRHERRDGVGIVITVGVMWMLQGCLWGTITWWFRRWMNRGLLGVLPSIALALAEASAIDPRGTHGTSSVD
jgi:hypothetical protein